MYFSRILICLSYLYTCIGFYNLLTAQFNADENFTFSTTIEVGSPPQQIVVNLDFGSADLSLGLALSDTECSGPECGSFFNTSLSNTLNYSNVYVDAVTYSDGSPISGYFVIDTVSLSGVKVEDANILMRNLTSISLQDSSMTYSSFGNQAEVNVLGLGPPGLQSTTAWVDEYGVPGPQYKGFIDKITNGSSSFSLWVDPTTNAIGYILFGGLDESLYDHSTLVAMPIVNYVNSPSTEAENITALTQPIYLGVAYQNLTVVFTSTSGSYITGISTIAPSAVAILTSRFEFSMPAAILRSIATIFGAEWSVAYNAYLMRCSLEPAINITMSNFNFLVRSEDILVPTNITDAESEPVCALNIGISDQIYLSNRLLRHYYILVNYLTNTIAFANPLPFSGTQSLNRMNASFPLEMASTAPYASRFQTPDVLTGIISNWELPAPPITFAPSQVSSLGIETATSTHRTYVGFY